WLRLSANTGFLRITFFTRQPRFAGGASLRCRCAAGKLIATRRSLREHLQDAGAKVFDDGQLPGAGLKRTGARQKKPPAIGLAASLAIELATLGRSTISIPRLKLDSPGAATGLP